MMKYGTKLLLFFVAVHKVTTQLALLSQYAAWTGETNRPHKTEHRNQVQDDQQFRSQKLTAFLL